jgi:hypothetical protein
MWAYCAAAGYGSLSISDANAGERAGKDRIKHRNGANPAATLQSGTLFAHLKRPPPLHRDPFAICALYERHCRGAHNRTIR